MRHWLNVIIMPILAIAAICGCSGSRQVVLADVASEPAPPADTADGTETADAEPADDTSGPGNIIELRAYRFGLEQAIDWALKNNISLLNARDQVVRAGFSVYAAAAAFEVKIVPKADASVSGGSADTDTSRGFGLGMSKRLPWGTQVGVSTDTAKFGETHTTAVSFDLTQPLLRGLGRRYNEDSLLDSRFALLNSQRAFIQYQESLIVAVVRAFNDIVRQREVLALNEKSAQRTLKHLNAAKARERVGLTSRIDVLRAEIQLRQAEDNLLSAREAYGDAVDNLKLLLGFGTEDNIDIEADLSYEEYSVDPEYALMLAMGNRLDLARARNEIDEVARNLRIAKNNTLPQLDLVMGYQRFGTGPSLSDSSGLDETAWTIGLATSTDLLRTTERAAYEQSKLDQAAAGRNYQLLKDTVSREVKAALRNLEKNRKRIDVQNAEIGHANQKLKLAELKFERGLADNFELIDAEEAIIRAETNYIHAVTDYIVSQVELKKTVGTLVERPMRLLR